MPNRLLGMPLRHSYRAQWGSLWPLQNYHVMNHQATVQRCSALFSNEIKWNEMFGIPLCFGLSEEKDMMIAKVRSQMFMFYVWRRKNQKEMTLKPKSQTKTGWGCIFSPFPSSLTSGLSPLADPAHISSDRMPLTLHPLRWHFSLLC